MADIWLRGHTFTRAAHAFGAADKYWSHDDEQLQHERAESEADVARRYDDVFSLPFERSH